MTAGEVGEVAGSILTVAFVIAEPAIKQWIAGKLWEKNGQEWAQGQQAKIMQAISDTTPLFNVWILAHRADILWAKADNRPVRLHVCVELQWTATDFGPGMSNAEVAHYDILYDGQEAVQWPNRKAPAWWWGPSVTYTWQCFDFNL